MDEEVNGVGDVGFDGLVRELDSALEGATGKPGKRLGRGVSVNGGKASAVSCVEGLKKIEGLFSPDFSQNDAFGTMAQTGFEQVADGDSRNPGSLLASGLEAD